MNQEEKKIKGRPKLDQKASIKLHKSEKEAWRAAAASAGLPFHSWVRVVCDQAAGVSDLYEQLERLRHTGSSEDTADDQDE